MSALSMAPCFHTYSNSLYCAYVLASFLQRIDGAWGLGGLLHQHGMQECF